MRKLYATRSFVWPFLLLGSIVGCHQEPTIPASAIPKTCQVYSIANVNEAIHDTTYYQYNSFGYVSESSYRQWINGKLATSTKQQFVYSDDYYLLTQTEQSITTTSSGQTQVNKLYTYTYQDGQLQQVAIADAQSKQVLGYKLYTYESNILKTYIETNAQKVPTRIYTYKSGTLADLTETGSSVTTDDKGKIIQKVGADGTSVSYQFDPQGQLLKETTVFSTSQSEQAYTYDSNPNWNRTQLLLRGIPTVDLGGPTIVHNVTTSSFRLTQNGQIVQDKAFSYQYQYNKAGYSLGYSRSDGFRQRIVYANCL